LGEFDICDTTRVLSYVGMKVVIPNVKSCGYVIPTFFSMFGVPIFEMPPMEILNQMVEVTFRKFTFTLVMAFAKIHPMLLAQTLLLFVVILENLIPRL
jgi:hypothetical protein